MALPLVGGTRWDMKIRSGTRGTLRDFEIDESIVGLESRLHRPFQEVLTHNRLNKLNRDDRQRECVVRIFCSDCGETISNGVSFGPDERD